MERCELLERYGRQMILPFFGNQGQGNINGAKVLLIGAGGIGSSTAMYLASSGVNLTIMDHDKVEISNLHRQIIHDSANAGMNKAESATIRLKAINPTQSYRAISEKLTCENSLEIFKEFDIIIDATDNFEARYIINDACVLLNKVLVSGSAIGMEGQVTVIFPKQTACFRCLYPEPSPAEQCRSCANSGVLGPVPGMIGCFQAIETLKIILSYNNRNNSNNSSKSNPIQVLSGRQLFFDALTARCYDFDLPERNVHCFVCGNNPKVFSMEDVKTMLLADDQSLQMAQQAYLGSLPVEYQLTVEDYHKKYYSILPSSSHLECILPHFIVDVRSSHQFALSCFHYDNIECFANVEAAMHSLLMTNNNNNNHQKEENILSRKKSILVNIPLNELRMISDKMNALRSVYQSWKGDNGTDDGTGNNGDIVVICRRGIDSCVATQFLLQNGFSSNNDSNYSNLYNIQGGLTEWKAKVDNSFPMY